MKSFLFPQILADINSPVNGHITVERYFGRNRIVVAGFWQSGEYSRRIMKASLRNLKYEVKQAANILLLGVGGGSAVEVINKLYPEAKITGVDIDPCMIEIGKKYFSLGRAKNLKIVISDAYDFILQNRKKNTYDIILTDLYKGCDYPAFVGEKDYFGCIKQLLTPGGVYIFNGSYIKEKRAETDELVKKTRAQFPLVELIHKKPNLIIRAYKK